MLDEVAADSGQMTAQFPDLPFLSSTQIPCQPLQKSDGFIRTFFKVFIVTDIQVFLFLLLILLGKTAGQFLYLPAIQAA